MTFTIQIVDKSGSPTIDLGKVKAWGGMKNSNLEILPIPGQNIDYVDDDTLGNLGYDINGPTKTINIESDLTGTFDAIQAVIKTMEDLTDGRQTQGTFHILRSNYVVNDTEFGTTSATKDLSVKLLSFQYEWVLPGLNKVHITIEVAAAR